MAKFSYYTIEGAIHMYDIAVIIRITEEMETKQKFCRKIPEGTKRITSMIDERSYIFILQANIPLQSIVRETAC